MEGKKEGRGRGTRKQERGGSRGRRRVKREGREREKEGKGRKGEGEEDGFGPFVASAPRSASDLYPHSFYVVVSSKF